MSNGEVVGNHISKHWKSLQCPKCGGDFTTVNKDQEIFELIAHNKVDTCILVFPLICNRCGYIDLIDAEKAGVNLT